MTEEVAVGKIPLTVIKVGKDAYDVLKAIFDRNIEMNAKWPKEKADVRIIFTSVEQSFHVQVVNACNL
jgi:hypothetical protein